MRQTVERITDDLTGEVVYDASITRIEGLIGEEAFAIDLGRQAAGALRAALIDHDVSKLRKLLASGRPIARATTAKQVTAEAGSKLRLRGEGDHSSAYAKRWAGISSRGKASKDLIDRWKAAGSPTV